MKVGYVGLGAMGYGMSLNLHKAGLLAMVWNRTRSKADQFGAETGVRVAADPGSVARRCDAVFINVSADGDVLEMVDALLPELSEGKIIIDCSTVSSDTALAAAERLRGIGASFLDAPVSGGVEGARSGTLSVMVGGESEVLEQVRPALEAVSARLIHMGPTGSGQATKAVNQIMAAGINQAVAEALAFGVTMNLDMQKVTAAVGAGAAGNWFLEHRGPTMVRGTYEPGFRVALHHKDLSICHAMAEAKGGRLPMVEACLSDYAQLLARGHGDDDTSILFQLKRALYER